MILLWVEGIDALNSLKPDLEHKTRYSGGLQGSKRGQKCIGPCVFTYVRMWYMYDVRMYQGTFRNPKSQSYEIRNLGSMIYRLEGEQQAFG